VADADGDLAALVVVTVWVIRSSDMSPDPQLTLDIDQEESKTRILLLVAGFVHDVTAFAAEHPGGAAVLNSRSGRDVTPTFYGGAWTHSTAAQNVR
jgi:stearoyl-CoA desaturase (Delta-9 desaturase)